MLRISTVVDLVTFYEPNCPLEVLRISTVVDEDFSSDGIGLWKC